MEYEVAKYYNDIHNTFTVPFEESKVVSYTSSIMKTIVALPCWTKFSVKLIFYITCGLASSTCCCILKSRDNIGSNSLRNYLLDQFQSFEVDKVTNGT